MVGAYLLDPARRTYDLIDIAAQRGLAAATKDADVADGDQLELGEEPPPDPAAEARLVWEIAQLQRKGIEEGGLEKLMDEVEMPLIEVLASMEQNGVLLDQKRLADIGEGFEQRIETLQAEIFELAGHEFTIGSPQQLAEVLFDELGLTKKRRGKTGFSTDARVLSQIREEHEIVAKVEQWRELTKLKNTYLDALPELIDPDSGRLHTTFNQTATATGRLSSTNPNLQNIPIRTEEGRPIRSCFVAPRGHRLLSADYNQIELRILAHIAGEDALKEIFARGEDIHAATASEVLGSDPKKVSPGERSKAKMVNYGIAYGLSAYGLADRLNIEQEEAGAYIDRYFERFPAVKTLHRGDDRVRQEGGLRQHAARPAPPDPGAPLRPSAGARPGRAPRGEHADPGHLGGHHQDRDGRGAEAAREVGPGDPPGPPDPRRAPLRGPGGRDGCGLEAGREGNVTAPSSSIRRSRWTSASARTGWRRNSAIGRARCPARQAPTTASSSSASATIDGRSAGSGDRQASTRVTNSAGARLLSRSDGARRSRCG